MFSVRLLFAVAGVLLILNTNQAKATVRRSRSTTYNQTLLLRAARVENENAISVLNDWLIPRYPELRSTKNALLAAQNYLDELLRHTAANRLATFTNTLNSELGGFFGSTKCMSLSQCNQTYRYVQLATGDIIGALLKEDTLLEAKKSYISGIIKGNITQEGDIEAGASLRQTYEVAVKVWSYLHYHKHN